MGSLGRPGPIANNTMMNGCAGLAKHGPHEIVGQSARTTGNAGRFALRGGTGMDYQGEVVTEKKGSEHEVHIGLRMRCDSIAVRSMR